MPTADLALTLNPDRVTPRLENRMTVHPLIFRLGSFQITGFGLMMMLAFLVGGWLVSLELRPIRSAILDASTATRGPWSARYPFADPNTWVSAWMRPT